MLKKRKRKYVSFDEDVYNRIQEYCEKHNKIAAKMIEKAFLEKYPQFLGKEAKQKKKNTKQRKANKD